MISTKAKFLYETNMRRMRLNITNILWGTKKIRCRKKRSLAKGGLTCGRRKKKPKYRLANVKKLKTTDRLIPKSIIKLKKIDQVRNIISFRGFRKILNS